MYFDTRQQVVQSNANDWRSSVSKQMTFGFLLKCSFMTCLLIKILYF